MEIRTIFEKPFDFDTYIEKRLLAIEDLEERSFARQFLAPALREIMGESERSYRRLEERVYAEVPPKHDRHYIYMTVVERGQYDITNGAWFPMVKGDEDSWVSRKITMDMDLPLTVDCLFYNGNGEMLEQIPQIDPVWGSITTKSGTFPAEFRLVPARRYRTVVEHMYNLFRGNGLPWTTLNCGYLLRFFDVEVVQIEGGGKEEIIDYSVSFDGTDGYLKRDRIPVWNVQKVLYDSTQFVVPIIDSKYFEHSFPAETFGMEHGYLLEVNRDMLSLRHTANQIILITEHEAFRKWTAYQVIHKPPQNLPSFDLPVLHNAPKDSFLERYTADSQVVLHSKLELIRQVEQYDLMGLLALLDVHLRSEKAETYDATHMSVMSASSTADFTLSYLNLANLDWFIKDDFVNRAEQKVLLFRFASLSSHFLQYDLLCFLTSQVQRQFNEYRCEVQLEFGGDDA